MENVKNHSGLDIFKLVFALLVVGAHTYPLMLISEELNHMVFRVVARIAVPFFLMVTGYFIIPKYIYNAENNAENKKALPKKFITKTALIYFGASLLYLPISIYAGHFSSDNVLSSILKGVIFDGTFYHLWYLPASIIGILIIFSLAHKFNFQTVFMISIFLYALGLLGDSYYGLAIKNTFLNSFYTALFHVFSYTRNGIFLAPVFLSMGGLIAKQKSRMSLRVSVTLSAIFLSIMLFEGSFVYNNGLSRHDSMYITLLPCMYFLFHALLRFNGGKKRPALRDVSLYI
ncbi:MAG: acyltransferase, partial [Oscillospiraceae bacterium]|nr:acyltransferase [Oscillospiraceae bacterium]